MATHDADSYRHARMTFTDHDCQKMYHEMLQTIQKYTGCSDASRLYALNPFMAQIWARATEAHLFDNLP